MSSTRVLSPQVILFVGRPTDLRKGLSLLFEAVGILNELSALPLFQLWIVGGSQRELNVISEVVEQIAALQSLRSNGRLMLWGRVENAALCELYSRALVSVIPSYSEEFGIVAVESMMSGCPVVAARTGGLADIVSNGESGTLFPPGDASTLAAVLAGYLRNPQLRTVQSEAARLRAVTLFSRSVVYQQITKLYQEGPTVNRQAFMDLPGELEPGVLEKQRLARVKEILRDEGLSFTRITNTHHLVFRIKNGEKNWCVKFFMQRPSAQSLLFNHAPRLNPIRGTVISYRRVLYNRNNPLSLVIYHAEEHPAPLVIFEWATAPEDATSLITDELVLAVAKQCSSYKCLTNDTALTEYLDKLEIVSRTREERDLKEFDIASAHLNSCMTGEWLLCRSHPQVELLRMRILLSRSAWPVPEAFRIRALQLIELLDKKEFTIEKPELAHGDLKSDHFLLDKTGQIRLADFEHSRYAVGPLDFAIWLSTSIWEKPQFSPKETWDRVKNIIPEPRKQFLSISWIVAELLFRALLAFSRGDPDGLARAERVFAGLGLLLFNNSVTR